MIITGNMGLTAWDLAKDDFDHLQLAANFVAIDKHDHTAGKGVKIPTAGIADKAITHSKLDDEAVQGNNVGAGAINTTQIDPNYVMLGTIVAWYPSSGVTTPGGGWELLDGRPWASVTNSMGYSTGNMPNMVGRFIRGANPSGSPALLAESGATSLSLGHSHAVESHSHSIGAHVHPIAAHVHSISNDGAHIHTYTGTAPIPGAYNLFQIKVGNPAGTGAGQFKEALTLFNRPNTKEKDEIPMEAAGLHNHGGYTGVAGGGVTSSNGSFPTSEVAPGTDSRLGTVSILPPNTAFYYIMKVR